MERFRRRGHRVLRRGGDAAARGRSWSSRSDRAGSRFRSRRPGDAVIGVDLSEGMLAVARELAEEHGVGHLVDLRVGDMREPPVDERVQLVICPFRSLLHMQDEDEKLLALRAAHELLLSPAASRLRRLRAEPRGHLRDARSLARARAGHLRARRLGRDDEDAAAVGALGRFGRLDGAALALGDRVAPPDRRGGLRRRRPLRLVRPPAVRRRRRHDLGLPQPRDVDDPRPAPRVASMSWV